MTQFCKYHPKQYGAWYCASCEVAFCSACVPEDKENYFPKCTLCRRSLRSLSVSHRIPPFWQQLPQLLGKPFNSGVMLFILLFALLLSLLPAGKIGLVLLLLLLLPVVELMFESMESVACGEELPKKVTKFLKLENKSVFTKLVLAYGFVAFVLTEIYMINSGLSILLSGFFILGLPASFIILMMEKSMFSMLNPVKIGFIIKQFASAYFLLYGFVLAIAAIAITANSIASEISPGLMASLVVNMLLLYLTLVVFLMAGYLVYQYHHELNFSINRQSLHHVDSPPSSDEMAEVNIFIQEGRYEDAQKLLLQKLEVNPRDYRASEKLILLYGIQGKDSFLQKIAEQYFQEMHLIGKHKQAADFLQKLDQKGLAVKAPSIEITVGLVQQMKNKQQFQFALELLDRCLAENIKARHWEYAYLVKAQLLTEYANRAEDAAELLQHIINRGIEQEVMQQAEDYLLAINQRV